MEEISKIKKGRRANISDKQMLQARNNEGWFVRDDSKESTHKTQQWIAQSNFKTKKQTNNSKKKEHYLYFLHILIMGPFTSP